jgi:hypothetical protein
MVDLKENRLAGRKKRDIATVLIAIAMLLMFSTYANLRWDNEAPAFEKAKETADTPAYVRVSGETLLSKRFWANARPPTFPLLLKVYAADKIKVASFHAAFSIFAERISPPHRFWLNLSPQPRPSHRRLGPGYVDRVPLYFFDGLISCHLALAAEKLVMGKSAFAEPGRFSVGFYS